MAVTNAQLRTNKSMKKLILMLVLAAFALGPMIPEVQAKAVPAATAKAKAKKEKKQKKKGGKKAKKHAKKKK